MRPTRKSHHFWRRLVLALGVLCLLGSSGLGTPAVDKIDFNFQVRPLLADRCFKCHGPDEKARKAKLRLDLGDSAFAIREPQTGRRALVPGHPEQSELYRRITAKDDDDRMPPLASNLTLGADE